MSKITRRNFLKVSGVAAAAAALTACGGSSSTASSAASGAASSEAASTAAKLDKIKVAVPIWLVKMEKLWCMCSVIQRDFIW